MTIEIFGLPVDYIDCGSGKETVLLLHGWGAPLEAYGRLIEKLSARYRVVAPQMPGTGKTPDPPEPMTLEDYERFVAAFCRALGLEKVILMGHSNGGRIILRLLSRPRPAVECEKAVLIDSAGVVPKRPISYYYKVYTYKLLKKLARFALTKPLFGALYEKRRSSSESEDYKNASEVMRKTLVNLVNTDLKEQMPLVRQNTLLIWGENDTATPLSDGQTMEKLMPNAGLAVIKNAGHFAFLENWPQFSAVLDAFL